MKVMAHRGFSGEYPENTMLAFRKAAEVGAHGIELDVHCTRDDTLVVIHDERVDRTTDGIGAVRDLNYRELRGMNAAKCFSDRCAFEKIPSFEEYCEWAAEQDLFTNIEVKTDNCFYNNIEQKIWDILVKYGLENKVMFSSFNHLSLVKLTQIVPKHVKTGALVLPEGGIRAFPGEYCRTNGFLAWHPPIEILNEENIQSCLDNHIEINVWTVNCTEGLQKIYDWNCHGIITNYPDMALSWLKEH